MEGVKYFLNEELKNIEIKKCHNVLHSSKTHFHNEISIGLIECGSCDLQFYEDKYFLAEKTLIFIPPEMPHKCNPKNLEYWQFKMLYFSKIWFEKVFRLNIQKFDFCYKVLDNKKFENIRYLFSCMEKGIVDLENESRLLKCLSFILYPENKDFSKIKSRNLCHSKIKIVKNFIDAHYQSNITLSDIEKISSLSRYYLIRQFEKIYGISPHQYQTILRINQSKNLIKKKMNISQVAVESGFYDQSHFVKYFKQFSGITPLEYRNSIIN